MIFILWLSLRSANLERYLPEPVLNYLQDLNDRLGLSRRIRLPASYLSSDRDAGDAIANLSIHNGDSSDDEDHDDELPLAHRRQNGHRSGGRSLEKHRSQRKGGLGDRFLSLFTGRGQASAYGLLGEPSTRYPNGQSFQEDEDEEAEGSVLQLPTLASSRSVSNHAYKQPQPKDRPKSSSSLFKLDMADLDAPILQPNFTHSPQRQSQSNPLYSFNEGLGSPALGQGFPRSPIRSPSLSRTPSLNAIAEETSPPPRNSSEGEHRTPIFPNFQPASMSRVSMSRSGSTDSGTSSSYGTTGRAGESSLPDWASAVSTQRPRSQG